MTLGSSKSATPGLKTTPMPESVRAMLLRMQRLQKWNHVEVRQMGRRVSTAIRARLATAAQTAHARAMTSIAQR
jgi:hypothetical protein